MVVFHSICGAGRGLLALTALVFCSLISGHAQAQNQTTGPDILFFGDSLTAQVDWQQSFPNDAVTNQGKPGDNTQKAIARIELLREQYRPKKIFFMLGINDLYGAPIARIPHKIDRLLQGRLSLLRRLAERIIDWANESYWRFIRIPAAGRNYETLLGSMRKAWPDSDIFVQSVLPTDQRTFYDNNGFTIPDQSVCRLNAILQKISVDRGFYYVDLYPNFLGSDETRSELFSDGVHLTEKGKQLLIAAVFQRARIK